METPAFGKFIRGLAVLGKEFALDMIPYYGDKRFLRQFNEIREHEPDNAISIGFFLMKYSTLSGTAYLAYSTLEKLL